MVVEVSTEAGVGASTAVVEACARAGEARLAEGLLHLRQPGTGHQGALRLRHPLDRPDLGIALRVGPEVISSGPAAILPMAMSG